MRKILAIFLGFSALFGGNLASLIIAAQDAKKQELAQFYKPLSIQQKDRLNVEFNALYTFSKNDFGKYVSKSGSLSVQFEYLLYDGSKTKNTNTNALKSDVRRILDAEDAKNLIAKNIAKLYFNAVALDEMKAILNKQALVYEKILKDLEFEVEFDGVTESEIKKLENSLKIVHLELENLSIQEFEIAKIFSQISNSTIIIKPGSKILERKKTEENSAKIISKQLQTSALQHENLNKDSALIPKVVLKDTQGFDNFDNKGLAVGEVTQKYLSANRPKMEFSWQLSSFGVKSRVEQNKQIDAHKQTLALNEAESESLKRLNELAFNLEHLRAKMSQNSFLAQNQRAKIDGLDAKFYASHIGLAEFVYLYDSCVEILSQEILDACKYEIYKAEFAYENGDEILKLLRN